MVEARSLDTFKVKIVQNLKIAEKRDKGSWCRRGVEASVDQPWWGRLVGSDGSFPNTVFLC